MKLDLYEILGEKKEGTKLYSPICGELLLTDVTPNGVFCKQPKMEEHNFVFMDDGHLKNYGRWNDHGECLLFPSSGMRDWKKFCWKRGDVVTDRERGITAMFDGWASEYYNDFNTIYSYEAEDTSYNEDVVYPTHGFEKVSDGDRLRFIAYLEKEYHGKFNAETMEIEKSLEPKNGDFICFVDEDSDRHYAIFKSRDDRWLKYHASVSPNGTWFNCNSAFGTTFNGRENIFRLRLATEVEKQVLLSSLEKNGKKWNTEKLCIEDLPKKVMSKVLFKPFDKVLVRCAEGVWSPTFFSRYDMKSKWAYVTVDFSNWEQCIPYSEKTAHLVGTTEDYIEE